MKSNKNKGTSVGFSKITVKQFRDAMVVVETYCNQINGSSKKSAKELGCRVALSDFGKECLKEFSKPHNKKGIVIDWLDWHSTATCEDGLVTVKWDGTEKPEIMHIHHVKVI